MPGARAPVDHGDPLLALVERLASVRDTEQLATVLEEGTCALLGCQAVALLLQQEDSLERLALGSTVPISDIRFAPLAGTLTGHAMLENRRIAVADVLGEPGIARDLYERTFIRGMVTIPVPVEGGRAALAAYWNRPHQASESELSVLEAMARAAARGLQTVRLMRSLRERETELERTGEQFLHLVEALPQLVWTTDDRGRCTYLSRQWVEFTGIPEAQQLDYGWLRRVVHPDDRSRVAAAWNEAQRTGTRFEVEYRLRGADGAYRWFAGRAVATHAPRDNSLRWFGTSTDIDEMVRLRDRDARSRGELEALVRARTWELEEANRRLQDEIAERRQSEARLMQTQRLEAVGQLTSGVAHDFNNLLTVVLGNIEILERRLPPDPKIRARLETTRQAAERGGRLTAQLLAFSSRQRLEPAPTDLNRIAADMGRLLPAALGGSVQVALALQEEPWLALVDPNQIELMILNLALNARDAMLSEGGTVIIETRNRAVEADEAAPLGLPPGRYVELAVADDGPGMDQPTLSRAFEPFFTTKPPGRHSGLGLAQVWGFARQSGGGAGIQSRPGEGTRVSLLLPVVQPGTQAPAVPAAPERRETAGALVLVVDDDEDVRDVTVALLSDVGYRVREASSGARALEILDEGGPLDLLLTDFAMPAMNGTELARQARLRRPELAVMFVSGYAELSALDGVEERQILQKPFHAQELLDRIEAMLASEASSGRSAGPEP
ncbi:response regulator [Rhizosaccharibacter radicis]|uniref:histidine kinase n=1 Tax=Rhizosaccharibacter radicis TaxID=2782605 RepID=A0ABT1VU74_9PROT|nr:response regulator [Acetobacteraceae bacterium KSS12]